LAKKGPSGFFVGVPRFGADHKRRGGVLKKLVVKPRIFPYQFGQMHRVGAGGKLFLPQFVVYKNVYQNNKLNWRNQMKFNKCNFAARRLAFLADFFLDGDDEQVAVQQSGDRRLLGASFDRAADLPSRGGLARDIHV